jgi:lambda family phage portal protein
MGARRLERVVLGLGEIRREDSRHEFHGLARMRIPFFSRGKGSENAKPAKAATPNPKAPRTGAAIRSSRVLPGHAEVLREVNAKMMRMYEAAITSNLNSDFPVSITSANAEILVSIAAGRARARKLERDNPYAHAILESFQNNVGGPEPFRLEMNVGRWVGGKFEKDVELNRLIEAQWELAGMPENCTVRRDTSRLELDLQAVTAMIRDGCILGRHRRYFPKNVFAYAIEPIEADRLDHYWNRPAVGTANEIQFSIELDEWKGAVAYHILTRHPGDVFAWSNEPKYRERVPAEDVIALFDVRTRAGQQVAMPRFSSIITRLHRIEQFDVAHVTSAIWSACKPLFILQEFPSATEYIPDFIKKAIDAAGEGSDADGEGEGAQSNAVGPGEVEKLGYGQKPFLVDPKFPIEAATSFKKDNLRAAAAGSGAAYHIIGRDLESVNFSSARIGLEAFRDSCKILQRHFILNYRRPHFNTWLKYAILSGRIPVPISRLDELQLAAKFYGRRWQYIQPLQDALADAMRLKNRLTSRDRIIAESERGGDYEEVAAELAADAETDEKHELGTFDPDGLLQGQGEDEQAEDKDKDDDEIKETAGEKVFANGR